MPALNFMKQFVPLVESGDKTHSIRAKRKRAWKVGDKLALYTGMRRKGCRLLGRTRVINVQDIWMDFDGKSPARIEFTIRIDGETLARDEADAFARRDGFTGLIGMAKFWWATHSLPFNGDVIHWKFPFEATR